MSADSTKTHTMTNANELLTSYKNYLLELMKSKETPAKIQEISDQLENITLNDQKNHQKKMIKSTKKLVRIEYPANVKNIDRAMKTLGGLERIGITIAEHAEKLQLNFHPENPYNKVIHADKDFKPGILLKITKKESLPCSSKDYSDDPHEYEVLGITAISFLFNRLCDFQYLPLMKETPEDKDSKLENIIDRILPKELPSYDRILNDDFKRMPMFLIPSRFAIHNHPHARLNVANTESQLVSVKDKPDKSCDFSRQKKLMKIYSKPKSFSIFASFKDKVIPTQPLNATLKLLERRKLDVQLARITELFKERPIWTKSAIRYNAAITLDHAKILLPVVAYYFYNGPWRGCWVRFGYDPRLCPETRIYQTLDYRVRAGESATLKVKAKRRYTTKSELYFHAQDKKKMSLREAIAAKPRNRLDERSYILKPNVIPPARQMFYQFCDLILPKIQDMLSQLPTQSIKVCDLKSGWLTWNFMDKARDIVNAYVIEAVQKEVFEETKSVRLSVSEKKTVDDQESNQTVEEDVKPIASNDDSEYIFLSSDEDESMSVNRMIQDKIPEKLYEDEGSDEDDEMAGEIDPETIDEINEMIAEMEKT